MILDRILESSELRYTFSENTTSAAACRGDIGQYVNSLSNHMYSMSYLYLYLAACMSASGFLFTVNVFHLQQSRRGLI